MDILKPGKRAFFFLKVLFLESKSRKELFKQYPPKNVYVFSSRISCYREGIVDTKSSAVAYAWYEFEKGYKGPTTIKWIN